MSLLNDNILEESDADLLAYYMKQYMEIEKARYNTYNMHYLHKYGGIIGNYDSMEDLMVVHDLKYNNNYNLGIYTYYYISRYHEKYNKSQFLLDYNKPWHCDYFAGSEVTLNYIVKYVFGARKFYCNKVLQRITSFFLFVYN